MVGDVNPFEDCHAATHPHVVTDYDVLVVLGELILIGEHHHGTVKNVGAVVAGDYGQIGSAHDVVADVDLRAGCEQRGPGAQVHVVAYVDIFRPGDLAAAAEHHILAARREGAAQRRQQEQLVVCARNAVEDLVGNAHCYAFLHTILSTTPV